MLPARAGLIDKGAETIVVSCPACSWRDVGLEEVALRRGLLRHIRLAHDDIPTHRDTLARWFTRKGIPQ
jgi:hypothetical protein